LQIFSIKLKSSVIAFLLETNELESYLIEFLIVKMQLRRVNLTGTKYT